MSDVRANYLPEEQKLGQDHHRELQHKHKWALGEAPSFRGRTGKRPAKQETKWGRDQRAKAHCQQNKAAKMGFYCREQVARDPDAFVSDSSAEEDVRESAAAPEPDAGYTYSFDAPRGPGKGSQILGLALAKAVDKFETKVTEKLVKDEYEVVAREKEDAHTGYADDEDDFEIV